MLTVYFILSTLGFVLWTYVTYKSILMCLTIINSSYKIVINEVSTDFYVTLLRNCTFQQAVQKIENNNRTDVIITMLDVYTYEMKETSGEKRHFICRITR